MTILTKTAPPSAATPSGTTSPSTKARPKWRTEGLGRRIGLVVAVAWIVGLTVLAYAAPLLPIQSPIVPDTDAIAAGPSAAHWLGTDTYGRDVLSRLIYGARSSLTVGFAAVVLGMTIGLMFGLIAGYFKGWADSVISAITDLVLAFPSIVLLMVLVAVRGPGLTTLVFGLGLTMIPTFTRLARANAMAWSRRDFVRAAEMAGARPFRVLMRDIAPNVLPSVLSYAVVVISVVIVGEGALSFLGFGIPAPTPSWGSMIAQSRSRLTTDPMMVAIPAITLFITVAAFNLIGDHLRSRGPKRTEVVL